MALQIWNYLIEDHAFPFTEMLHCYLPKHYILICQSCALLITNFDALLFTDYTIFTY
jgi:hypothetical protein